MMEPDILDFAAHMRCKELHMLVDEPTGLRAIIALHNTTLGPALGGCRFLEYHSTDAAVVDAIRLAQAMAYKSALANMPFGGGKMVLVRPIGDVRDKEAYFKAVGRFVDSLNGRYITTVDSGTNVADMDVISSQTTHVVGTSHGLFEYDDPSIMTARGVVQGMRAAVKFKLGHDDLAGLHVAIQGLGHAGYQIAKILHAQGARLTVYDINIDAMQRASEEFGARAAGTLDEILSIECDIFAPCALGGVLNDHSISMLKASIVAGCANNQLAEPCHGLELMRRGILYAPDYVINAGGLIYVAAPLIHMSEIEACRRIDTLYDTLMAIFVRAQAENSATNEIADAIALERLKSKA